jgi:8-oxo-dGTP diphosphatase
LRTKRLGRFEPCLVDGGTQRRVIKCRPGNGDEFRFEVDHDRRDAGNLANFLGNGSLTMATCHTRNRVLALLTHGWIISAPGTVPHVTRYTPIVGTLAYVYDRSRGLVLLVHRNARPTDGHLGKYNGLGGKLEEGESVVQGVRRELMEEAGIELTSFTLRGTVNWPGFDPDGQGWLGFIFLVDGWSGTPPASNEEGTLEWVPVERLVAADLPMWEGDRHFLPLVFDDDQRAFHGVMPYVDGKPNGWTVERLA